jgi:hypothetical protein
MHDLWHGLDPQTVDDVRSAIGKTIRAIHFTGEANLTRCVVTCTDGTRFIVCATTDACDSPFLAVDVGGPDA